MSNITMHTRTTYRIMHTRTTYRIMHAYHHLRWCALIQQIFFIILHGVKRSAFLVKTVGWYAGRDYANAFPCPSFSLNKRQRDFNRCVGFFFESMSRYVPASLDPISQDGEGSTSSANTHGSHFPRRSPFMASAISIQRLHVALLPGARTRLRSRRCVLQQTTCQ